MNLREAYQAMSPATFLKTLNGSSANTNVPLALKPIYDATVALDKYRIAVASQQKQLDKKELLNKIVAVGSTALDYLDQSKQANEQLDTLAKAAWAASELISDELYSEALAALVYKAPQQIGKISNERKTELEQKLKAGKVVLLKKQMRELLASCKKGYEVFESPYTLALDKKARTYFEPIISKIDKNENPVYQRNDENAKTLFKLKRTDNRQCETILVKKQQQVCLEAYEGEGGPPPDRDGKAITGKDAEAIVQLATRAIQIARGLCENGTFNNAKGRDERGNMTYQSPRANIRWLISKSETMRNEFGNLYKPIQGVKETPLDPNNVKNDGTADNFLRGMAAMGKATFISGGGVCAQMSHLTVGILTMIAPPDTQICVVYDKAIDHSYTVICGPNTDWFVCDPWPTSPHVIPWVYCCFPKKNILNHFRILVKQPVSVAYGIAFKDGHVKRALYYANKEVNHGWVPDHEWIHTSNLILDDAELLVFQMYRAGKSADQTVVALTEKGHKVYYVESNQRLARNWQRADVLLLLQDIAKERAAAWLGERPTAVTKDDWGSVMSNQWKP